MLFSRIKTPFGDFDQIVSVEMLQAFAAPWAASIQNYLLDNGGSLGRLETNPKGLKIIIEPFIETRPQWTEL